MPFLETCISALPLTSGSVSMIASKRGHVWVKTLFSKCTTSDDRYGGREGHFLISHFHFSFHIFISHFVFPFLISHSHFSFHIFISHFVFPFLISHSHFSFRFPMHFSLHYGLTTAGLQFAWWPGIRSDLWLCTDRRDLRIQTGIVV